MLWQELNRMSTNWVTGRGQGATDARTWDRVDDPILFYRISSFRCLMYYLLKVANSR